jgi:hypothetical protein
MPKTTKRTKVKDLPRSKQDLNTKAAKKVKGGVLPAVSPGTGTNLSWTKGGGASVG